ncbi:MAG: hypothetical protein E7015_04035 [Alphaproteobacteria bacterium]|nr:hypothetical protein [Alphaproteobacteria bacterium]
MYNFKYFVLWLALFGDVFSMQFDYIVRSNASNPAELIRQLELIEDQSEEAEAFLQNFGGEGFQKKCNAQKRYSDEISEKVKEAAFIVGSEMRKIGASQIDSTEALEISKIFLDATSMGTTHNLTDQDVSGSLWSDQLDDMIANRQKYQLAVKALKERFESTEDEGIIIHSVLLPNDVLDEL